MEKEINEKKDSTTIDLIAPLETKRREIIRKRDLFLKEFDEELNKVDAYIKDVLKEVTGISDNNRTWVVGDVFTTNFWSDPEVCLIRSISGRYILFARLESIRSRETAVKD